MPRCLRIAAALLAVAGLSAVELSIAPDRADGVYAAGEPVTWTITAKDAAPADLAYTVKSGGMVEIAAGTLRFADGKATVKASLDGPGTLLLGVPHDGKQSFGGAAYDWQKIPVSAPEPKDFDEFWQAKLAELAKVPVDPVLEPVESGVAGVKLWKITMGNIRGTKIHGYFARPEGDAPCPAMLAVQWAGVYPLDKNWSVGPAKNGWMVLNLIAHDLPVDEPKAFYEQQAAGPLKDYTRIGRDDRDTSYFLRMYLSCYRGADYLVTRPDWDRKTLLVQGGSQGGLQSVMTAGLHPAVTTITANVPAGCDHTGALVKRTPGWPFWTTGDQKTVTASTYYDVVNFARRIKCPVLIGMGLIDTTCSPAGVFAMINQIQAPKRVVIMPTADHSKPHDQYYAVFGPWWNAAKDGRPLPLK
jgi:cephalosporin-C deacetylase-like acetyl esterase